MEVTARQHDVLRAILTLTETHGWPPSVRELASELGNSSPAPVYVHLTNLERLRLVSRRPGREGVLLTESGRRVLERVAA